MSQEIVNNLVDKFKISETRAQKLLNLADGNFEKAKQLFIENMCAIKGQIISDDQKTYGVLLIILNEMGNTEKVNMSNVILSKEKEVLSLSVETPYKSFNKSFYNLSFSIQLLTNLMNEVNNYLTQNLSVLDVRKIYAENDLSEIEAIILKVLKKIIKDFSIELKLDYELISYTEYHIPKEKEETSTDSEEKEYDEVGEEKQQKITTIKCDYKLAPAKGRAAKNLQVGDLLYVKINDSSPEAVRITNFLKEKYQGKIPDLRLPIIKIETNETERLSVFVQITETVRGALLINQEVNVKVYDPDTELLSQSNNASNSLPFQNKLAWIIGIIIVIFIIIMIFK
jgi:hypothetical protein